MKIHEMNESNRFTPQKGESEILKLLVKNGANVNSKDIHNYTSLIWAAQRGKWIISIVFLIKIQMCFNSSV